MEYVALLRGINVGGHRVSMADLRKHFEKIKFRNVRTFIASGNVLFESESADAAALEARIEAHLLKVLGYEAATFLRTPAELVKLADSRPFGADAGGPNHRVHIAFVKSKLTKGQAAAIEALSNDYDQFVAKDREFHWLTHGPYHESRVKAAAVTKAAGGLWTARNLQTVKKLAALQ